MSSDFAHDLANMIFENESVGDDVGVKLVQTFDEAGLLTSNDGVVVTTVDSDGDEHEFQITIVQSR